MLTIIEGEIYYMNIFFVLSGVDINYAPLHVLTKIAGVGEVTAKALIDYRTENGRFSSREELKKVKRIGDKMFNQMSGFVRIFKDAER